MPKPNTTYKGLSEAFALVFDAISLVGKGLLRNPSKEQKRKLNRRIARLEVERAEIAAKMDAIEDGVTGVKGPTATQVARIAILTAKVDKAAAASQTASAALTVSAKVLAVVSKIADA